MSLCALASLIAAIVAFVRDKTHLAYLFIYLFVLLFVSFHRDTKAAEKAPKPVGCFR